MKAKYKNSPSYTSMVPDIEDCAVVVPNCKKNIFLSNNSPGHIESSCHEHECLGKQISYEE